MISTAVSSEYTCWACSSSCLAERCAASSIQPAGSVQGRPTYAKPPIFKSSTPPPSPVLEAAVKRFMARDARKIFEAHWEEAKKRYGAWNAGLTLKAFLEKNTKVRPMGVLLKFTGQTYTAATGDRLRSLGTGCERRRRGCQ